jgi:hypothetical protein
MLEEIYSVAMGRYMQLSDLADRTFVWGYSTSAVSIDTPDAFLIDPNNYGINVGIGTDSPSAKLDVAGDIDITGTLTIRSGNPAKGKVLTATNSSGTAAWQPPSGGNCVAVTDYDYTCASTYPNISATATCPTGKIITSACTYLHDTTGSTTTAVAFSMYYCKESAEHSCVGGNSCSVTGKLTKNCAAGYVRILCCDGD